MHTEARKIQLIEDVLKIKSEAILIELEAVLKKFKKADNEIRQSAHDFVGVWSKQDADLIEKAIEEGCEQINPDDWK